MNLIRAPYVGEKLPPLKALQQADEPDRVRQRDQVTAREYVRRHGR